MSTIPYRLRLLAAIRDTALTHRKMGIEEPAGSYAYDIALHARLPIVGMGPRLRALKLERLVDQTETDYGSRWKLTKLGELELALLEQAREAEQARAGER